MDDWTSFTDNSLYNRLNGVVQRGTRYVADVATSAFQAGANTISRAEVDNTGLSQSAYNFNYRVFPEDLASDYQGHYLIININVPVNRSGESRSKFINTNQMGSLGQNFSSQLLDNELSKVDALRYANSEYVLNSTSWGGEGNGGYLSLKRGTRRIAESIAIFMPSPVIFTNENRYEEISLTALAGEVGKLGTSFVGAALAQAATTRVANALRAGALTRGIFDALGNPVVQQAASLGGYPINPKVEVLFSATPQRQFTMEWLMAPKNERESDTIKNIIQTLRFHAAPEMSHIGVNDIGIPSFIPPAEFDITFYNKGKENTNIPRINTCVLERIEVQYDPSGVYSTFRNGHPVGVRLGLAFRETEIIHKQRILQGF
jgi:hypothetical protein